MSADESPITAAHLLSASDLAVRWGVSRDLVYSMTRAGELPAVRLGRVVRYRLEAIEDFERAGGTGA